MNVTRLKLLLLTIVSITTFNGCASLGGRQIVLHPIEKRDIQPMTKGVAYTPEVDGWFLSDLYMKEVNNARIQQSKKVA